MSIFCVMRKNIKVMCEPINILKFIISLNKI